MRMIDEDEFGLEEKPEDTIDTLSYLKFANIFTLLLYLYILLFYCYLCINIFMLTLFLCVDATSCKKSNLALVYSKSRHMSSLCEPVRTIKGDDVRLEFCKKSTCLYGGDTFNYRQGECLIRRCGTKGLQLSGEAGFYDIYTHIGELYFSMGNSKGKLGGIYPFSIHQSPRLN